MDDAMISDDPFWRRVDIRGPDECWLWQGRATRYGYGEWYGAGQRMQAHRRAYELSANVTLPREKRGAPGAIGVCHTCDVRRCCNPKHLWLGTRGENNKDRAAKGRSATGDGNGQTRLRPDEIPSIRRQLAAGLSMNAVANRHCVNVGTIWQIARGETWKHIV